MGKKVKLPEIKKEDVVNDSNILYMVLRLQENIIMTDFRSNEHSVKLSNDNVAGYAPIFKSLNYAESWAENGKYKIIAITT